MGVSTEEWDARLEPLRERCETARGAWMQAARCGVISFFTLSRSMGKIFCTKASSCCLKSSAGYFASTYAAGAHAVSERASAGAMICRSMRLL